MKTSEDIFGSIIQITQFMQPDGRAVDRELEVSPETYAKWEELTLNAFRIECEWLPTGHVSATITDFHFGDFKHVLCKDGDQKLAQAKLEEMILAYDADEAKAWRQSMEAER